MLQTAGNPNLFRLRARDFKADLRQQANLRLRRAAAAQQALGHRLGDAVRQVSGQGLGMFRNRLAGAH